MSDDRFDEKELQKREEKSADEKSWDEKYRRDPVSAIIWAVILIWAGVVFLAENLGFLSSLSDRINLQTWSVIFLGAGVIVFIEVLIRLAMPEYRRPVTGSIFFALFLIGIGLSDIFGWQLVWPLILIALGLSFLLRGVLGER
jgi:hypothetical protein